MASSLPGHFARQGSSQTGLFARESSLDRNLSRRSALAYSGIRRNQLAQRLRIAELSLYEKSWFTYTNLEPLTCVDEEILLSFVSSKSFMVFMIFSCYGLYNDGIA